MARGQRTTKSAARRLPSQRELVGRSGYFPIRTGHQRGVPTLSEAAKTPPPPDDWPGTLPEWALYDAALQLGLKPDRDFVYQYRIGTFGASDVVDFFFLNNVIVEVQGLFWHYGFDGFKVSNDQVRKIRLESLGYPVIFIDEDALVGPRADPVYYLKEALAGRDYSRAATGNI